jgi:hydroxypyruvate reductase 1
MSSVRQGGVEWKVYNAQGKYRVLVTKTLVGDRWIRELENAGCRIEVCQSREILSNQQIAEAIGDHCDAVIGQLTEKWNDELFGVLKKAGGVVYSNFAVGFDNIDVAAATKHGIPVGNTPGVLTEATAEMAVCLTYAAARHLLEANKYLIEGKYKSWLPDLFLGQQIFRKKLGIIGTGRIGSAYALSMVRGNLMDLVYYDKFTNKKMEEQLEQFNQYLKQIGEKPIQYTNASSMEQVIREADILSLHPNLDSSTYHLMNAERLRQMKPDAILVNCARGPIIDEAALVEHCKRNPGFTAGLDVFEHEPALAPGLKELPNVVIVPHIASATFWTRSAMATIAALNIASILKGYPCWSSGDMTPFVGEPGGSGEAPSQVPPQAAPSILNAKELGLQFLQPSKAAL